MHPEEIIDKAVAFRRQAKQIQEIKKEIVRQHAEAAKKTKEPLRCPASIEDYRKLNPGQIRELMAHPDLKARIDGLFQAEAKKQARAELRRQLEDGGLD